MTVEAREYQATISYAPIVGSNLNIDDDFPIPFKFLENDEYLKVYVRFTDNSIKYLVLDEDYKIVLSDGSNGVFGTLNLLKEISDVQLICISRNIENDQNKDFDSQTIFSTTTENALDKLTMLLQDNQFKAFTLHAPDDENVFNLDGTSNLELHPKHVRAGKYFIWGPNGEPDETGEAFIDKSLRQELFEESDPSFILKVNDRIDNWVIFNKNGSVNFIKPDGVTLVIEPVIDDENHLILKCNYQVDDNTIIVDDNGKLKVNLQPKDKTIVIEENKIGSNYQPEDNTIVIKENKIKAEYKPMNSTIVIEGNKISANFYAKNNTIKIENNALSGNYIGDSNTIKVEGNVISGNYRQGEGILIEDGVISALAKNEKFVYTATLLANKWEKTNFVTNKIPININEAMNVIAVGIENITGYKSYIIGGNNIWYSYDALKFNKVIISENNDNISEIVDMISYPIKENSYSIFVAISRFGKIYNSNVIFNWYIKNDLDNEDLKSICYSEAHNCAFIISSNKLWRLNINNNLEFEIKEVSHRDLSAYPFKKIYSYQDILYILTTNGYYIKCLESFNDYYTNRLDYTYPLNSMVISPDNKTVIISDKKIYFANTNNFYLQDFQIVFEEETTATFIEIAYGEGYFIVVGSKGTILYSNDCINWNKYNINVTKSFTDVIYDEIGKSFIILASSEEIVVPLFVFEQTVGTSPDGLKETDVAVAGPILSVPYEKQQMIEWNKISYINSEDNAILARCFGEAPVINLNVQLKL